MTLIIYGKPLGNPWFILFPTSLDKVWIGRGLPHDGKQMKIHDLNIDKNQGSKDDLTFWHQWKPLISYDSFAWTMRAIKKFCNTSPAMWTSLHVWNILERNEKQHTNIKTRLSVLWFFKYLLSNFSQTQCLVIFMKSNLFKRNEIQIHAFR